VHEPAWLAWRLAPPGAPYTVRRRSGRCEVWADSGSFGIPVLLGEETDPAAGARLPAFGARSPLRAWAGLDPARRFRWRPYAGVPLRLRPSPLQLVFRPLAAETLPARGRVRFEALDFDAW
jgi:hypothetical protein